MSILSQISNLSQIGTSISKLAGQGYQIVKLAKSRQTALQCTKNVKSKPDFKFDPNPTKHSKVNRSGLPDCEIGKKMSNGNATRLKCQG